MGIGHDQMTIYGYILAEGLQRRGSALVCSVCTVDSNADIDAGWRLGRLDLSLNLGFDHVDHDTRTH